MKVCSSIGGYLGTLLSILIEFYLNQFSIYIEYIGLYSCEVELLLKTRGRKRTPGEEHLLAQVRRIFKDKKDKGQAKQAAKDLKISLASFYKYAKGDDLPRMEVLRDAQEKWQGVKWDLIDVSQITRKRKIESPEQFLFSFLKQIREEDVKIAKIGPKGERVLQVLLNIRFPG